MATNNPASMLAPSDFDVEGQSLARKRKLLEALQAQSMTPTEGQMVSGHYVAPSPLTHIGKVLSAYMADKGLKASDKAQTDLSQRYNTGLSEAIQNHLKTQEGTPESLVQGQGPLANPDEVAVNPAVAPDRRKAMVEAMTSQFKPMQELGKAEFAGVGKDRMTQKDILSLSGYDKKKLVQAALSGDISNLSPEQKVHVVNGQLVREADDTTTTMGDFRDKFEAPANLPGPNGMPIREQKNLGTGEVKGLGASGTTVNVDTKGATHLANKVADLQAGKLESSFDTAKTAQGMIGSLRNAKQLLGAATTGFGADQVLGLQKLGAALGIADPSGISSTEQLGTTLANNILGQATKLKGAISDKEMPFLQAVAGGTIKADAKTLQRVIDVGIANSVNAIRDHASYMQNMGEQAGTSPEQLKMFGVSLPDINGLMDSFSVDENSKMFTVPSNVGSTAGKGAAFKPLSEMTRAEKLEQLRQLTGDK